MSDFEPNQVSIRGGNKIIKKSTNDKNHLKILLVVKPNYFIAQLDILLLRIKIK